MDVRVRYAPSPTGNQHIGGVRTALFNYFFAKANNGSFLLRIEDTDQERFKADALQDIYNTFHWLDIHWDEGPDIGGSYSPYIQSERSEIYKKYALELVKNGFAYYCYCTTNRLQTMREAQELEKSGTGYDRHCRNLSEKQQSELLKENSKPVIRLKIPSDGSVKFHDELLGDIEILNSDINPDPVLLKSDGFPTYHLANVIDDHLMKISHILRAQEWIPSVPIHIHLYKAFGWEPPYFVHLPMVKGEDGQKLAKRHGATSLIEFRKKGYLPEAIINYISLLGWAYNDSDEFFLKEDLEKLFTLKKLNKSSAIFDYKKLDWFNGIYIRKKENKDLKELLIPYLVDAGFIQSPIDDKTSVLLDGIIPLIKERIKILSDVTPMVSFLFQNELKYEAKELIPKKTDAKKTMEILLRLRELIVNFDRYSDLENEELFKKAASDIDIKLGNLLSPLRVALTGSTVSPPLFESVRLLGSEKTLKRIDHAIKILSIEE